jgi:hypothetical protein
VPRDRTLAELAQDIDYRTRRAREMAGRGLAGARDLVIQAATQDYTVDGAIDAAKTLWNGAVEGVASLRKLARTGPGDYRAIHDKIDELKRK